MPQQPMPVPDWNFANYVLNNNLVDKFELLRGVPGICLEPVSWGNIKKLVAGSSLEELSSLGRHPSGIVEYRKFRSKIRQEYDSMEDFILIAVFGYEFGSNSSKRKTAVKPDRPPEKRAIWRLNDFPYNFEEGVSHHNLWSEVPLTHKEIVEEIQKHAQGHEAVYFVNPAPLASIPGIWHAHIVSRPRP